MPSVKTPPGMRRMWNSSRTGPDASRSTTFGAEPPDIVALDAAGLAVVATEAVATEARESGVAATGTLAMEKLRRTPSSSSSCTCCPGSQA